jgi:hypothetical protein
MILMQNNRFMGKAERLSLKALLYKLFRSFLAPFIAVVQPVKNLSAL